MIDIFIDADVIMDLLLKREPFFASTARLFSLIEENKVTAFTSPVVMANIFYISARLVNREKAFEYTQRLLSLIRIAPVDERIMRLAVNSDFNDFEDSIQYYAAKNQSIDYLITRNIKDYKVKDMAICTPTEFLLIYSQKKDSE